MRPEFVETFPSELQAAIFYVSVEFNTCAHLCACGCGQEVITPLSPVQWSFTYNGQDISLRPSVGNWSLPCQSHYVIDNGRVRRAKQYSQAAIARNRAQDHLALEPKNGIGSGDAPGIAHEASRLATTPRRLDLLHWIRSLFRRDG